MEEKKNSIKILLIGDQVAKGLYDYYDAGRVKDVDLILSCGDLSPRYLSFLVSMTNLPLLYINGNHDECYRMTPPDGCICIDGKIAHYKGLRILGLGGSMRYSEDAKYQYTQKEMNKRIRKLRRTLFMNHGFDILLSHSPAWKVNDGEDLPHQGFQGFVKLLDKYSPMYFFHGHVHMSYGRQFKRLNSYKETQIVNGYEWYILEIPTDKIQNRGCNPILRFLDKNNVTVE